LVWGVPQAEDDGRVYRSPLDLAFAPGDRLLAVTDCTAGSVVFLDPSSGEVTSEVELRGEVGGVAWSPNGGSVFVAEVRSGTAAEIDVSGKVRRRLSAGLRPLGLAVAPRRGWLLAASSAEDAVSVVSLSDGREMARIRVVRMPYFLAVSADERFAVVGNRLPAGDASNLAQAAAVSLVDLPTLANAADISLPPGSTNVHGVAIGPEGKWAYVAHNLGRVALPTTQIEYGWINANALSIIDLRRKDRYATILLDRANEGAANPWGVAVSPGGQTLWVTT